MCCLNCGICEPHASQCTCFWGYFYAGSFPAWFWWKFLIVCTGADRGALEVCLRGTIWALLILPWLAILMAFLFIIGIIFDFCCIIAWSVTCGCCFKVIITTALLNLTTSLKRSNATCMRHVVPWEKQHMHGHSYSNAIICRITGGRDKIKHNLHFKRFAFLFKINYRALVVCCVHVCMC